MSLPLILLIGLGGFIGTIVRYLIGQTIGKSIAEGFPYATLLVNLIGCLAIGLIYGYFAKNPGSGTDWKSILTIGVCGGFTTFSAFSYETLNLISGGKLITAVLYVTLSLLLGLALTLSGLWLMGQRQ